MLICYLVSIVGKSRGRIATKKCVEQVGEPVEKFTVVEVVKTASIWLLTAVLPPVIQSISDTIEHCVLCELLRKVIWNYYGPTECEHASPAFKSEHV